MVGDRVQLQKACPSGEPSDSSFREILYPRHISNVFGILDWHHGELCFLYNSGSLFQGIDIVRLVTAYSPVLPSQAGYSKIKLNGLTGGLNTIGIIGIIISAQIVDRLGRRRCLMLGSAMLFAVEIIVGSLLSIDVSSKRSLANPF